MFLTVQFEHCNGGLTSLQEQFSVDSTASACDPLKLW